LELLTAVLAASSLLATCSLLVVITRRSALRRRDDERGESVQQELIAGMDLLARRVNALERVIHHQTSRVRRQSLAADHEPFRVRRETWPGAGRLSSPRKSPMLAVDDETSDRQLIEQIAHEMKTPLAAIKARALIVSSILQTEAVADAAAELSGVVGDVAQCESVLVVFRQVVAGLRESRADAMTLGQTVRDAHSSATAACGRHTTLIVENLPDEVPGFPSHYLAAILRPLVVNAVEASPLSGEVKVCFVDDTLAITLVVENSVERRVDSAVFRIPGQSTKAPNRGLGILTVRTLADLRRGSKCEHEISDCTVRARVELAKNTVS
jgi:signal transduction histidine kinase